jgi:cytochrome c biogenesis protein ResB
MKRFSDRLYDALRSVKLAAVLIVLIILLAIAGGIIPQGEPASLYARKFPGVANIILSFGLNRIFSGIPFLLISALFTINLTVCSFHRLFSEMQKSRNARRHGPDLLHVGLVIFIFGGILTARTRSESFIYLGKGQTAGLPDGGVITLVDLSEEHYPDGRPKSYESIVTLNEKPAAGSSAASGGNAGSGEDFDTLGETGYMDQPPSIAAHANQDTFPAGTLHTVKVNKPLRHNGYTIYQQDWHSETQVQLQDAMGINIRLQPGQKAQTQGGFVLFMSTENNPPAGAGASSSARAEASSSSETTFLLDAQGTRKLMKIHEGETIGPFTFVGFTEKPISGLKIVRDKGYPFVVAGLILVVLGTFLTYARKLKGMIA